MARLAFLIPDMGGGGAERVAALLIRGFVERGHAVDLVMMRAEGRNLDLVPPEVRRIDLQAARVRQSFLPIVDYLRREQPDAMEVSMWPLTVSALLAARVARVPTRIVTADHTNYRQYYRHNPLRLAIARRALGWTYPWAAGRIAVSRGAADDLADLTGIDRATISVVPNPVPPSAPGGNVEEVAPAWSAARTRILSVGNLHPMKRHDVLVDAVAELDPALDAKLLILGEGGQRAMLEAKVAAMELGDRVFLPGYVDALGDFYERASLFAMSSELEGLPTVLIEALHAGLPIVSTDCPSGPREILDGGQYGRLVPMGNPKALSDAIAQAVADNADAFRQRRRAADYSGDCAVDAHLDLLLRQRARGDASS